MNFEKTESETRAAAQRCANRFRQEWAVFLHPQSEKWGYCRADSPLLKPEHNAEIIRPEGWK